MRHLLFLTEGPVCLWVSFRGYICWFYPWLLMHNLTYRIWGIKCESNSVTHISTPGKWQMYQSKDSCWEGKLLFESSHSLSFVLTAISWQLIQLMAMSCCSIHHRVRCRGLICTHSICSSVWYSEISKAIKTLQPVTGGREWRKDP